jgi:hypothetical protein
MQFLQRTWSLENLWSSLVSSPSPSCQNSQHRGTMAAGPPLPHSNAAFAAGDIRSPGGALEVQQCLCQAGWQGIAAVRRPLCGVGERGVRVFQIKVGSSISVDHLKPHTGEEPVQPAALP